MADRNGWSFCSLVCERLCLFSSLETCFIFILWLEWIALFGSLIAQPTYCKNKTWDTETFRAWSSRSCYFDLCNINGELLTTLLRATRAARSFNLQVIIMHASQVCSQHSFGLPLRRMNGIHRKQFNHSHLDLLWSLRIARDHACLEHLSLETCAKRFYLPSLSPSLRNLVFNNILISLKLYYRLYNYQK